MEGAIRRRSLVENARERNKTARRDHHRATRPAAKVPVEVPVEPVATPRQAQERMNPIGDIFAEPPPVFTIRPNTNVR
ncbi:hypothetical protein GOFOIKOB_4040 [Methylobacterium tardum]|uniref:Uncharacterized protein n=1 Tax=Methylobacterium tardum TaxID=374432 RepID=A0AA37TAZ5_9HYPH|nr:hypothetical protein GOFOIKOB_4040 [Methylobacterium tardum]GLS69995.1 hypothetical protein GCM10007890_20080 [Methylobacterium tardum]